MKKVLIAILMAVFMPSHVISDDQVIYVYRNDGNMDAFFQDEIDSVRYSKLSVDSVLYPNYVTQEFYTQHGLTRIPLEAIDSISTYQPPTIMKSDVFILTDARIQQILKIDSLDVTFSSSAADLPTVGQVLVTRADCQTLDEPFIGRVKNIERTTEGVVCHCVPAGIDDIYEQITFFGRAGAGQNTRADRAKRVEASFEGELYNYTTEIELHDTAKVHPSNWTFKLTPHLQANFEVLLHKEWGEPMTAKFKYSYEHTKKVEASFDAESVVFKFEKNIYKKQLPRIWFATIPFVWFTPRFTVDVEANIQGYFKASGSLEWGEKKTHELTYYDGNWEHKETTDTIQKLSLEELAIGGKLEAAVCPSLNVGLYESEYGLGIGGSFGVCLEGGYKYDTEDEMKFSGYSILKDVQETLTFPLSTNVHVRHDLFGEDDEDIEEGEKGNKDDDEEDDEMEDHVIKEYEYELPGFTWYLLPTFHHVYLLDFPENNQYQASMKIERDLLMPVYVGYLLEREIESASRGDGTITSITPIWGEDDPEKLLDDVQTIHWFGRYWSEDDVLHYGMMRKVGYNQPGKGTLHPIVRFPWMKEDEFLICPQSYTTPFNGKQLYSDDGSGGGWVVP